MRPIALALLAGVVSGCVTTYQPLTSLQRPSVVDPQHANFEGVRMLIRCVPGDYIDAYDSQQLCRGVATLFRNQGAEVDTDVPRPGRAGREADPSKPDLILDLESRLLHEDNSTLLWIVSAVTFTILPAITEYSFAQDVTIRDSSGTVLLKDSLQGRFVRYFGAGVWSLNVVLDAIVRPKEDEIVLGAPYKREFSRDFYAQLSQLAFNANVRSVVLRGFQRTTPPPATGGTN